MPSGPRIRGNNSFGVTTDNPLTLGATSFNSAGLVTLPVVSAAHAVVVLDPKRIFGEPEIVVVTTHTAAATVATIIRGQYGTVARAHPLGTVWGHVPVDEDYIEILTSGTRPSDPYRGQTIFETDTSRFKYYTGTAWHTQSPGPTFVCKVTSSVATNVANGVTQKINFDTVIFDEASAFSLVNDEYIAPMDGYYQCSASWQQSSGGSFCSPRIFVAGTLQLEGSFTPLSNGAGQMNVNGLISATAGQAIDFRVFNFSGGGTALGAASAAGRFPIFCIHRVGYV